ncbi:MAG: 3-hydroxyisobutyrate dehydrogenase [Ktedonobacteraceae bacterium]
MTTSNTTTQLHIGFVGLGRMGSLMVERLMQHGYTLAVYDRTKEKTQDVVQKGATAVAVPRDLGTHADVIISMVTDNSALDAVMYGSDGVLAGTKEQHTTLIDMSTVSPEASRKLFHEAKEKGVAMIDAAVSGSTPQVQEGSLVFFVGGEESTYQRCKPLLDTLGKSSFYMGESGNGTTMKMVVNTMLGLGLQAVAEAIALGEKAGLDRKQLLDVLGQTTVIAPAHKAKLANAEHKEYPVNFALATMRKDFSLIMRLAAELSVAMPATAAAEQMYAAALAQGHDEDFSVMIEFMEKMSGIKKNIL